MKDLSGITCNENEWFHQLTDGRNIQSILSSCGRINQFFTGLTSCFIPLTHDDLSDIEVQEIPWGFPVSSYEAFITLKSIKVKKAPGHDGIHNTVLKEFPFDLASVIADIYNASLRKGYPSLL